MLSPKSSFVSNSNSILSMKLKYRGKYKYWKRVYTDGYVDGEQSVTKWEDDKTVTSCPYCTYV
jgi:hypothetical protein